MYATTKRIFLCICWLAATSCLKDGSGDCDIYLDFIFDHNMEYTDSFGSQVGTVDVYVFDSEGRYLFSKSADRSSLREGKRMLLDSNLPAGDYSVVTVGGMSEFFAFTDEGNKECTRGSTHLEQVRLALLRQDERISHEFPHIWFGQTTTVSYNGKRSVWPVKLVRNTNKFHLSLLSMDKEETRGEKGTADYLFEIVTPEGGVYGHDNSPLEREEVVYRPYRRDTRENEGKVSGDKINTVRLLAGESEGYTIVMRRAGTEEKVWEYDLLELLEKTKPPSRPDGTHLPFQEYLDRQGEWNLVIMYTKDKGDNNLTAVGIEVNGWILWLRDLDI